MWEAEWPPNRRRRLWRSHWVRRGEKGEIAERAGCGVCERERPGTLGLAPTVQCPKGTGRGLLMETEGINTMPRPPGVVGRGTQRLGGPRTSAQPQGVVGIMGRWGEALGSWSLGLASHRSRVALGVGWPAHWGCTTVAGLPFPHFSLRMIIIPIFHERHPGHLRPWPHETLAVGAQTRIESPVRGPRVQPRPG